MSDWSSDVCTSDLMSRISIDELYAMLATGAAPLLIDVRSSEGRAHDPWLIPGARAVDIDRLEHEIEALTRQQQVVLYCACPNEISAARVAQRMCADRKSTRLNSSH